jgi:hypothetical protein
MNLALAIVFIWVGCALMFVAFHGLDSSATSNPATGEYTPVQGVFGTLQADVKNAGTAYAAEGS